jgi:hypothetical protein
LNDGQIRNPSKPFAIVPLSNFVPRGFGFVHHSIAILYHEVPNLKLISRFATFSSQYSRACALVALERKRAQSLPQPARCLRAISTHLDARRVRHDPQRGHPRTHAASHLRIDALRHGAIMRVYDTCHAAPNMTHDARR